MYYLLITKGEGSSTIQPLRLTTIVSSPKEAACFLYHSDEENGEYLNDIADLYAIDEGRMTVSKVLIPKIKFEE